MGWTHFRSPREEATTVENAQAICCDDLLLLLEWQPTYDALFVNGKVAIEGTLLPDLSLRGVFWEDLKWRWNEITVVCVEVLHQVIELSYLTALDRSESSGLWFGMQPPTISLQTGQKSCCSSLACFSLA